MTQDLGSDPVVDPGAAADWMRALYNAQREQWDALVRWQLTLLEMQQDAWDRWICRWAGGVPIDA